MTAPPENISVTIGILALQGCVEPHRKHLLACGADVLEVRTREDLNNVDGLIIPGGESTTLLKLLNIFSLEEALINAAKKIPFWGICAGAILMAKKVTHPEQTSLALMDIEVERNSYGRQLESFTTQIEQSTVAFIRAPRITKLDTSKLDDIQKYNDDIVFVRQGRHQVSTFHPELSQDAPSRFHQEFVQRCLENKIRHNTRHETMERVTGTSL